MRSLLFINVIRSKGLMVGLFLLFTAGLISLQIGKNFLDKNKIIIEKTRVYQQESIENNVELHSKDIGLLLYYLKFGYVNKMPRITGLSIGQRDINSSLQSVTIRNLEEQKYATDLMNPLFQLLGNMDFSFVLIYLFPLIIIAFSFNLISEEKEGGTWSLVISQTSNPISLIKIKLFHRFLIISCLLIILLLIAILYLNLPFDLSLLAYFLFSILYISFWFSIIWLILSFHLNSSQNATYLLLTWLMLIIIIPAGINAISAYKYPVPEALSTILESRDGYHNKWDEPKEPTVAKFQQHYPQFIAFKHPEGKDYSWLWYYAMQQMGDDDAAAVSKEFQEKLLKRNQFAANIGLFFPSIHTQRILNSIAKSDLGNHLSFLKGLEEFHEKKRLYYYPKIFKDVSVQEENWKYSTLAFFDEKIPNKWYLQIIPYLIFIGTFLIWGNTKFRTNKY